MQPGVVGSLNDGTPSATPTRSTHAPSDVGIAHGVSADGYSTGRSPHAAVSAFARDEGVAQLRGDRGRNGQRCDTEDGRHSVSVNVHA